MADFIALFLIILGMLTTALAQPQNMGEKIWGSVVFTVPGDAPLSNSPSTLTSLGSQQAMLAGSTIRRRYIDGDGNNITGVARIPRLAKNGTKDIIDHKLLDVLSTDDQRDVATALSFLQGLYPPLSGARGNRDIIQWPSISAVTKDDYKFNWLAGANECSTHAVNRASYRHTKPYNETLSATYDFYQSLPKYFPSLPSAYLAYTNAPTIASIAEYQHSNNATFARQFSTADVAYLRSLASQHVWDNYGRYSQGNGIPVIGGRMLSGKVLGSLTNHITSYTTGAPLTLLFGPVESLISFFSISGLAAKGPEFRQLPLPGSVLVLEIFSDGTEDPLKSRLLDPTKLNVRALFRNGTSDTEALNTVPLFYRGGPAGIRIPWSDFNNTMTKIAVQSPGEWCTQCKAMSIFCAGFLSGDDATKKVGDSKNCPATLEKGCGKVSPTAAGFIGALVATILFITAIAMLASCTGGKLAAWRKKRTDNHSEEPTSPPEEGLFGWVKRRSITRKEKRNSDPDIADTTPGNSQPKTNSWELRSNPNAAGMQVLVNTIPSRGTANESVRPISSMSPLEGSVVREGGGERLRSTKDYSRRDVEQEREEEAAAAGVGAAVPRHII